MLQVPVVEETPMQRGNGLLPQVWSLEEILLTQAKAQGANLTSLVSVITMRQMMNAKCAPQQIAQLGANCLLHPRLARRAMQAPIPQTNTLHRQLI